MSPLVDLAELHDDPKLQRYAAAARRRLVSVLESVDTLPDPRPEPVRVFDLRHAVNRALREAVFVSGRENVMMDLGPYPLPVSGEQFVVERAVTHLVGAVLNHTGHGYARLALETDADTVALTVVSDDCTIPTGEMSRIAASFDGTAEGPRGAASIRLAGGETEVFSPGMNARSGPSGSAFAASWVLARG
ncbi:MAG: hypothetical protein GX610_10635 [Rhodococcus sp.]|nr:hypothetical protein [Rhodococcus sp. (in: high G+C Gram-positive bacteria)]